MQMDTPVMTPKTRSGASPASTRTRAEDWLRAAAVRSTGARIKVLSALLETHSALTHQDIQERFHDIDRVTLYRTLDCLTEAGLAHKIAGDDRVFRYSAGAEHGPHAHHPHQHGAAAQPPAQHQHGHFKCTRCARIFCLEPAAPNRAGNLDKQLRALLRDSLGPGFEGHDIELTIKGWCGDCSR